MPSSLLRRLAAVIFPLLVFAGSPVTTAGEIYSTMRNVNAVPEAHGFRLNPAFDAAIPPQATDLAPPQAFEILRPLDKPVTIGRLFTSCSCIQLESNKRTFRPGERAVLQLHNIRPTPPAGQVYAIFVQITSPIRATLRFDTFVQSGTPGAAGAYGAAGSASGHNNQATNHQGPNNPGLNNQGLHNSGPAESDNGTASLLYNNGNANEPALSAQTGADSHNLPPVNSPVAQPQTASAAIRVEPKISAVKIIEEDPLVPAAPTAVAPTLPVAPLSVNIIPEDAVTPAKTPAPAPAAPALPTAPLVQLPTAPLLAAIPAATAPAQTTAREALIPSRNEAEPDNEVKAEAAAEGVMAGSGPLVAAVRAATDLEDEEEGEEHQEFEDEENYLTDVDVTASPAAVGVRSAGTQTNLAALPGVTAPARGAGVAASAAVETAPLVVETPLAAVPAPQAVRRTTAVVTAQTVPAAPQVVAAGPVTPLLPLAGNAGTPAQIARSPLAALPAAVADAGDIAVAEMDEGQAPLGVPPTMVAGPGAILQSRPRINVPAVPAVPAGQAPLARVPAAAANGAAGIAGADLTPEEYEQMILRQRYDRNLDKDILTQFATVPPAIDPYAGKADPDDEAAQNLEGTADLAIDFGDALGDMPSSQSRPRIAEAPAPARRNGPQIPLQTPAETLGRNAPIILPDADIVPSAANAAAAVGARPAIAVDAGGREIVRGAWESPEQAQAHGIEVREVKLPAGVAAPLTAPASGNGVVTVPIPVQIQATPPAGPAPRIPQPVMIQQPALVQQPTLVQQYQQPVVAAEPPASLTVRNLQPTEIAASVGAMPPAQTVNRTRRAVIPPEGIPLPPTVERNPNARKPVQAVSLITVGVRDLPAAIRFYEALGWSRTASGKYDQTAFFQLQGQVLALYPMHELLREQNMQNAKPAPGGITLALHVQDRADVWAVYQRFLDAGGSSLRVPSEMPSGAVSCYVADPDGNPWEISWVPQFHIDDDGGLWLP